MFPAELSMRNITLVAKRLAKMFLGKDFFTKVDYKYNKERFGSEYGGWDIVVEFIDASSIVYSFGVGEDATFDTAMINRFGRSPCI